jgi:hypothetical protein
MIKPIGPVKQIPIARFLLPSISGTPDVIRDQFILLQSQNPISCPTRIQIISRGAAIFVRNRPLFYLKWLNFVLKNNLPIYFCSKKFCV